MASPKGFIIAAISIAASAGTFAQADPTPLPVIDILYPDPNGSIFDASCNSLSKTKINPDSVHEAVRRVPELQALWNREGPQYLSTTFAEIGLPFPYKEMQVTLTVCPGVHTMSSPLFFNVESFLSTAAARLPDEHFVEQLYHELMHNYVRRIRDVSLLRKKYAGEPQQALSHLHVAALEKFVLLKLGKTEELKRVASDYQNSQTPGYRRAWEIVNDIEGYQPFVDELKQFARAKH